MNTENISNEAEIPALNKGDVSGSLSFDDAEKNNMTFGEVVRFWKPDATNEEVDKIITDMKKLAHNDAILGRRDGVTAFMLFDRIKYTYFRELNCH